MFLANLFPAAVSQGSASLGWRSICCTQWHVGITTRGFMSSLCSCSKNMLKYVKQWKLAYDVWFHLLAAIPPGPLQSDLPNPILLRIDLGCGSASKVHSSFSVWHQGCQPASQQPALSLHAIHPELTVIRIIWFNLARWVIKCSDCLRVFGTFLEQCDGVSCKGKKREKKTEYLCVHQSASCQNHPRSWKTSILQGKPRQVAVVQSHRAWRNSTSRLSRCQVTRFVCIHSPSPLWMTINTRILYSDWLQFVLLLFSHHFSTHIKKCFNIQVRKVSILNDARVPTSFFFNNF